MFNLLLDERPTFTSTDGSVRADLKSASPGWLFWSVAGDAIDVLTCGAKTVPMVVSTQSLHIAQKALGY